MENSNGFFKNLRTYTGMKVIASIFAFLFIVSCCLLGASNDSNVQAQSEIESYRQHIEVLEKTLQGKNEKSENTVALEKTVNDLQYELKLKLQEINDLTYEVNIRQETIDKLQAAPKQTTSSAQSSGTTTQKSQTVYITETGSKYHRSGCQYLSKSKIAISLDDAKASGYSACSKCW